MCYFTILEKKTDYVTQVTYDLPPTLVVSEGMPPLLSFCVCFIIKNVCEHLPVPTSFFPQ